MNEQLQTIEQAQRTAVELWTSVPNYAEATREIQTSIAESFRQRNIVIPQAQWKLRSSSAAGWCDELSRESG